MELSLLRIASLYFLVPALIVAALAAAVTSRFGVKGRLRLLSISLAVAMAVSPVLSGAGHGAIPMSLVVWLLDGAHSADAGTPGRSVGFAVTYVIGVSVLTPIVALVLHLFFRRWAYDRR